MFLSDHGAAAANGNGRFQHHQQPVPPLPPRGLRSPKTPMYVPAVLRNNYLKKVTSAAALNGSDSHCSPIASVGSNNTTAKIGGVSSAPASPFIDNSNDGGDYFSIKSNGSRSGSTSPNGILTSRPSSPAIIMTSNTTSPSNNNNRRRRQQQRPSRTHWRRDETATNCRACDKVFTFFERRHHCRRCGEIFCGEHSSHLLRLDAFCNFNPDGLLSRSCDSCAKEYSQLLERNEQEFTLAMQQRKQRQKQNQLTFVRASSSPDRSLIYYQDPSTKMTLPSSTNISLPSSASTGLSYSSDHSPQSNAAAHTTTPTNSSSQANGFFSNHPNPNSNNNNTTTTLTTSNNYKPPGGGHVDKHDLAILANNATALDGRNPGEMPVGSVPADWSWSTF